MPKHDEPLPGTEVEHPMMKPPAADENLPTDIRALREEIARLMTPLDGRTDHKEVVRYLRDVYDHSVLNVYVGGFSQTGFLTMLGLIHWEAYQAVRRIDGWMAGLSSRDHAADLSRLRQQRAVILGHAQRLSEATMKPIAKR